VDLDTAQPTPYVLAGQQRASAPAARLARRQESVAFRALVIAGLLGRAVRHSD